MTVEGLKDHFVESEEWIELLRTNLCPLCGSNLTNIPDPTQLNRLKIGCINCNRFFIPQRKPPREKVKRKATLREKEKIAEKSGGSLYPPLSLFYFCPRCYENDLKQLKERAKREAEIKGVEYKGYTTTGDEGISLVDIINRSILPEIYNVFPFSCRCGYRYRATLIIDGTDPKQFPRFGIELGFHNQCVGCRHSFDKLIGTEEMFFRCDFTLQCSHIRKHLDRIRMVPDDDN